MPEYYENIRVIEPIKISRPEPQFRGKSYLESLSQQMNEPGLIFPFNTIGAPMSEVTYGRLVRIPVANPREGSYLYEDVTVKTAKSRAKAARKLAKQIEKACR